MFRLNLFIFLVLITLNVSGQSKDSLENILASTKNDSIRASILNQLGYNYITSKPSKSLEYAQQAMTIAVKTGYDEEIINANLIFGIVKKTFGEYDMAADYYFTALRLSEKLKLKDKESNCLNNIGSLYQTQNNLLKALEYFKKSLEIERTMNDKAQTSIRLYNIGTVYESMDSLETAYTYYFNSLLIEQELQNKEGEFFALYGISGIETKKGSYDKALVSINKALNIAKDINNLNGISICFNELGALYKTMNDYSQAITAYDSSIYYASLISQRNNMRLAYKELAAIYRTKENYSEAFRYLSLYTSINDTINNLEINNKVAEMESRFEIDKKENEILYLKKTSELNARNSANEKRNKYFLLITFILCIILAVSNLRRIISDTSTILIYSAITFVTLIAIAYLLVVSGFYDSGFTFYQFFIAFVDVITIAILPIFVFVLMAERVLLRKHLRTAKEISEQIQEINHPVSEATVLFQFENEKNQLQVALKDLVCIEANDNYSAFYYYKDDKIKKELFRTTLKNIEDQLQDFDTMVRCHKSFIVNIRFIKRISGNAQGYRLHFQDLTFEVPVSRRFPKDMLQKIKSGI
ncbi:MAG: hypothetical protein CVU05_05070 [Bacteroidetes bacterium HGW-Bacteroidetes-21]|nr:MAG: hypothetical protein CVU05_05070 [Bacteroidetes bacterium HGW-Bacteroidetes-21]